jgi:hypothetical protein
MDKQIFTRIFPDTKLGVIHALKNQEQIDVPEMAGR